MRLPLFHGYREGRIFDVFPPNAIVRRKRIRKEEDLLPSPSPFSFPLRPVSFVWWSAGGPVYRTRQGPLLTKEEREAEDPPPLYYFFPHATSFFSRSPLERCLGSRASRRHKSFFLSPSPPFFSAHFAFPRTGGARGQMEKTGASFFSFPLHPSEPVLYKAFLSKRQELVGGMKAEVRIASPLPFFPSGGCLTPPSLNRHLQKEDHAASSSFPCAPFELPRRRLFTSLFPPPPPWGSEGKKMKKRHTPLSPPSSLPPPNPRETVITFFFFPPRGRRRPPLFFFFLSLFFPPPPVYL